MHRCPFSSAIICAVIVSLVGTNVTAITAGQLSAVRQKVQRSSPKSSRDEEEERKRREANARRPRQGTLRGIRNRVANYAHRPKGQPHRASQRHRHGHDHRSHGMRGAVHFHHVYAAPTPFIPSIVEEYHFCEPPPVASPSDYLPPEPYPTPSVAPKPIEFYEPWSVRFDAGYGSDTDDLSRLGFDLLANRTAGLGIDTSIKLFREESFGAHSHLWLGDVNIIYELFPTEYVRPRAGIGLNWLADDELGRVGLNLTLGADVQLTSRITATGEIDFGTLGQADLFHGRATVGLKATEHLEWFVGYDHYDIGGAKLDAIIGGLRFRF